MYGIDISEDYENLEYYGIKKEFSTPQLLTSTSEEYFGLMKNNICTKSDYSTSDTLNYHLFMLPEGMTREEGFKILSYLTDFIEKRKDTEACSLKSVRTLDGVLDLDRFGFQKVTTNPKDVIDLFTVSGRILLFKQSEFYEKYFEWYTENVTRREIEKIYKKYNMTFEDIIWLDKPVQKTLRKKDEN